MANPPQPVSTVNMDASFQSRVQDLITAAGNECEARVVGAQVPWFRPGDWNGSVFDRLDMAVPFDRSQANDEGVAAINDATKPGTVGDVIAATSMIDTLACMERAFRVRYTLRRPAGIAQLAARKCRQGDSAGPLSVNYLEYVTAIIQQAKA